MTKVLFILLCTVAIPLGACTGAGERCATAVVECGCPGGARGAQFCQPDGSLGRCECPGVELESDSGHAGDSLGPGDESPAPGASSAAQTAPTRAAHPDTQRRRRAGGQAHRP